MILFIITHSYSTNLILTFGPRLRSQLSFLLQVLELFLSLNFPLTDPQSIYIFFVPKQTIKVKGSFTSSSLNFHYDLLFLLWLVYRVYNSFSKIRRRNKPIRVHRWWKAPFKAARNLPPPVTPKIIPDSDYLRHFWRRYRHLSTETSSKKTYSLVPTNDPKRRYYITSLFRLISLSYLSS